eukprot:g9449.t1
MPEIAEAIKKGGGEDNCYAVATLPSHGIWAVGLAGGWKPRESACKLALRTLARHSGEIERFAKSYPDFVAFCQAAGTPGAVGLEPAPKKAKVEPSLPPAKGGGTFSSPRSWDGQPAAGAIPTAKGNGKKGNPFAGKKSFGKPLPRDAPIWVQLPQDQLAPEVLQENAQRLNEEVTDCQRDLPEESIRCLWVGEEESGGGPMGFGVEFDIDASVPCCVQLYWGLSATACNDLAHRGQLDFLTAPRGSRPATNGGGFSNSLRQLRGRWTGGRSYANPETTRSLLEMEELNLTACQAEPCAEPQSEDRIFSTRDFVAQSRDFFLPAGCGQRYVTPAGDLIHPDRMAEFDFLASWLRAGQAEPGATIPLAIVVLASGRVSGPVQGRAILETKGEISTVRFHMTGPTQGQSNFPFHTAEIFRQLCLGEQMLLEVQGIFGFEEAGDTDCMICYARPKNVQHGLVKSSGGVIWSVVAVLLGLVAAGLILYVYLADAVPKPFCGLKLPTFPGVKEEYYYWGVFAAAACLSGVMLLSCVLSFSSGFGGNAFNWAASEVGQILEGVQTSVDGVSTTAEKVTADLQNLYKVCPPSIEQMLGSSVTRVKGDISKASEEAELAVKALKDFPGLLQHGVDELRGLSTWLPIIAGLSLATVLVCCGAAWLQLLSSQNATVNKRLTRKLSPTTLALLLPCCVAASTLILCVAACAEYATASTVTGFCRDDGPDAKVLQFAEQNLGSRLSKGMLTAGKTSSAYSLTEHYLTGTVDNPATDHLELAKQSVLASVHWITEYKTVLQQTCPKWNSQSVFDDLKSSDDESKHEELNSLYYVVYAISAP